MFKGPLTMNLRPLVLLSALLLIAPQAFAADSAMLSQASGDAVWVVTAAALVFFMQAGFALLESGMSRSKNTINVIMKNYLDLCLGTISFWVIGFGLMFGTNLSGWIGEDHFFMNHGDPHEFTFLLFQMMFATTAVTIASGAMAERTRFSAYLIGAIIICGWFYPVFGSWAWGSFYDGSGWLSKLGFIDFAGSTVVHSIGGWIALAGIIVLGPRLGRFDAHGKPREIPGHNLTLVALGGFILWLGWFGFNAGSTVSADISIGLIALNTHLAAAAGVTGAMLAQKLNGQKALMTTAINGSLAGLVSITAGCASMTPGYALLTGFIGGIFMYWASGLLLRMRIDDVVGAVPVHGIAGAWGTIAAGMFLKDNMFSLDQIIIQVIGVMAAFIWVFPGALLMYYLINKVIKLRIEPIGEQRGLDYSEHAELGYPEFQQNKLHQE